MTVRTLDPATPAAAPGLHPVVARVLRQLERNVEGLRGWDTVTLDERPYTIPGRQRTDTWVTIHAERYANTLAYSAVQVFVLATGPMRGRLVGAHRYSLGSKDRKMATWADLRGAW